MSDKYITYGKGCDIDPEEVEIAIPQTALFYTEDFVKVFRALQQREEMRKEAIEALNIVLDSTKLSLDAELEIRGAIRILEGTDG